MTAFKHTIHDYRDPEGEWALCNCPDCQKKRGAVSYDAADKKTKKRQ